MGHGSGGRYFGRSFITECDCKAVSILMGCSRFFDFKNLLTKFFKKFLLPPTYFLRQITSKSFFFGEIF